MATHSSAESELYSDSQHVTNLVLLVGRLVQQVRRHENENTVVQQAMDYLRRANLQPSILRGVKQNLGVHQPIDLQTPLEDLSQAFAEAAAEPPVPQTERCGEKA